MSLNNIKLPKSIRDSNTDQFKSRDRKTGSRLQVKGYSGNKNFFRRGPLNFAVYVYVKQFITRLHNRVQIRRQMRYKDRKYTKDSNKRISTHVIPIAYEPTYHMNPIVKPKMFEIYYIMEDYLKTVLKDKSYVINSAAPRRMTMIISEDIRSEVKAQNCLPDRYKCVVFVTLGQKNDQCLQVASRSVWDSSSDRFISYKYENNDLFCVVSVYAVYCE